MCLLLYLSLNKIQIHQQNLFVCILTSFSQILRDHTLVLSYEVQYQIRRDSLLCLGLSCSHRNKSVLRLRYHWSGWPKGVQLSIMSTSFIIEAVIPTRRHRVLNSWQSGYSVLLLELLDMWSRRMPSSIH